RWKSDEGFRSRDRMPDDAHLNYSNGTVSQAGRAPLFPYANRIVLIRRRYRNLCHVSDGLYRGASSSLPSVHPDAERLALIAFGYQVSREKIMYLVWRRSQ